MKFKDILLLESRAHNLSDVVGMSINDITPLKGMTGVLRVENPMGMYLIYGQGEIVSGARLEFSERDGVRISKVSKSPDSVTLTLSNGKKQTYKWSESGDIRVYYKPYRRY